MDYAARPLSDFNVYEALEMMESLQDTARDTKDPKEHFYRLAYQTARSKTEYPKEHFRTLVIRVLGDQDHNTVFEAVAKVEKTMAKSNYPMSNPSFRGRVGAGAQYRRFFPRRSSSDLQCRFCKKFGHIAARCFQRRSLQTQVTIKANLRNDTNEYIE